MTSSEIKHRRALAGIGVCGAKERDGAKVVAWLRYVTCPECWRKTEERRLAARRRDG